MNHSPEPWRKANAPEEFIVDKHYDVVADADIDDEFGIANRDRIIACVNACRGIPNEELEDTIKEQSLRSRFYSNNFPIPEWVIAACKSRGIRDAE